MKDSLSTKLKREFIVPYLLDYVYWVIQEAKNREIKTLYFLARDGCILQKMAVQVCEKEQIPICCKYLFCSRASLRMPTYALIGEEAFDLLLVGGYQVSKHSLLARAELNWEQRCKVWAACGEQIEDEDRLLGRSELEEVRKKLKNNSTFRDLVIEKSKAAYSPALGYFQQEGLFDSDTVAIVDSGWTGSMQRSLGQLLRSDGFRGELIGFYFGMYVSPKDAQDGTYLTYYFDKTGKIRDKIPFSNNLFECLLQAPHGMTVGYEIRDGSYFPVMASVANIYDYNGIRTYVQEVSDIAWSQIRDQSLWNFDPQKSRQETRKLTNRYMAHPKQDEAEYLGRYLFCDDVSESYHAELASPKLTEQLKQYLFLRRVWIRLFSRNAHSPLPELYWPYGTVAFLPKWRQPWFRGNIYLWELIRHLKNKNL